MGGGAGSARFARVRSARRRVAVRCASMARKGRPPTDTDATKNLQPEDETQVAPKGTVVGKLDREKVLGDFRKIAAAKPK